MVAIIQRMIDISVICFSPVGQYTDYVIGVAHHT